MNVFCGRAQEEAGGRQCTQEQKRISIKKQQQLGKEKTAQIITIIYHY